MEIAVENNGQRWKQNLVFRPCRYQHSCVLYPLTLCSIRQCHLHVNDCVFDAGRLDLGAVNVQAAEKANEVCSIWGIHPNPGLQAHAPLTEAQKLDIQTRVLPQEVREALRAAPAGPDDALDAEADAMAAEPEEEDCEDEDYDLKAGVSQHVDFITSSSSALGRIAHTALASVHRPCSPLCIQLVSYHAAVSIVYRRC